MKNLKALALVLFAIMALIFIGCGGAVPGVAGANSDPGYGNDASK
jgi:hypothetical protein